MTPATNSVTFLPYFWLVETAINLIFNEFFFSEILFLSANPSIHRQIHIQAVYTCIFKQIFQLFLVEKLILKHEIFNYCSVLKELQTPNEPFPPITQQKQQRSMEGYSDLNKTQYFDISFHFIALLIMQVSNESGCKIFKPLEVIVPLKNNTLARYARSGHYFSRNTDFSVV